MMFDGHRYRLCRWCKGRGCLYCEAEADAAYKRAFPDGPQPIATFTLPDDAEAAKKIIGREALEKAFGPGGGGVAEIDANFRAFKSTEGE